MLVAGSLVPVCLSLWDDNRAADFVACAGAATAPGKPEHLTACDSSVRLLAHLLLHVLAALAASSAFAVLGWLVLQRSLGGRLSALCEATWVWFLAAALAHAAPLASYFLLTPVHLLLPPLWEPLLRCSA